MATLGGCYTFGEKGMQPSKFFSVTIFRTHSIGCTRENLGLCCYFY